MAAFALCHTRGSRPFDVEPLSGTTTSAANPAKRVRLLASETISEALFRTMALDPDANEITWHLASEPCTERKPLSTLSQHLPASEMVFLHVRPRIGSVVALSGNDPRRNFEEAPFLSGGKMRQSAAESGRAALEAWHEAIEKGQKEEQATKAATKALKGARKEAVEAMGEPVRGKGGVALVRGRGRARGRAGRGGRGRARAVAPVEDEGEESEDPELDERLREIARGFGEQGDGQEDAEG